MGNKKMENLKKWRFELHNEGRLDHQSDLLCHHCHSPSTPSPSSTSSKYSTSIWENKNNNNNLLTILNKSRKSKLENEKQQQTNTKDVNTTTCQPHHRQFHLLTRFDKLRLFSVVSLQFHFTQQDIFVIRERYEICFFSIGNIHFIMQFIWLQKIDMI